METNHVVGLEGKSGNPSPITALGAFHGIKAALKHRFVCDDISKYSYAIQGVGQTGGYLMDYLFEAGATKIYYAEINERNIKKIQEKHPKAVLVEPDLIYSQEVDVFVPCALGGVLNDKTIPLIKAQIVAGTSNNVLSNEKKHDQMLKDANILYAPDFVINAGGVINVYHEIHGYNKETVIKDIEKIYDRLTEIFNIAKEKNIPTQRAANIFAEQRIKKIHNVHKTYLPKWIKE